MARMLATPRPRRGGSLPAGLVFLALVSVAAAPGCSTGPLGAWSLGRDKSLTRDVTKEEYSDAVAGKSGDGDRDRLMSRWLETGRDGTKEAPSPFRQLIGLEKKPKPVATDAEEAELKAAQELAKSGQYAEALPTFTRIARRNKGGDLAEVALFFKGECQFQQGDYVGAAYTFEELGKDFPTSRYLEKAVQREYAIGTFWLASIDGLKLTPTPPAMPAAPAGGAKADGAVKLASTVPMPDPTPVATPHLPQAALGVRDHFTGTLPMMDVGGTAIRVLEKVRHHDPTGPLADDAVLLIARYHDANQSWDEASLKYEELITDNPKSPLVLTAQLESIDARIKSYVGPEYEGAGLEQARSMVEHALSTVPPDQTKMREHLYVTLDVLREQEAERAFIRAEFYRKLGRGTSAEYMFAMIPQKWPKSPWAAKAKERLSEIAALPRKESLPSKIMTLPGAPDPYTQGVSPNGMGNNMSMPY
jgi:TolA-binding protein